MTPVNDLNGNLIGHLNEKDEFIPVGLSPATELTLDAPLTLTTVNSPITQHPTQTTSIDIHTVQASSATEVHSGNLSLDLPLITKDKSSVNPVAGVSSVNSVAGNGGRMTTKGYLEELRGLITSTIMGDSRLKRHQFDHPSWLNESVTRIVARGYVTDVGQFRKRFNRFMLNPPEEFTLYQMRLLEHACGCPSYEWERLPIYHHYNPHPAGMSDEDAGKANRRQTEAFSAWCRETNRLLETFGGEAMCEEFETKKSGPPQLVASKDGLSPLPPDSTRMIFRTMAELKEFEVNEQKWNEILETNVMIRQKSLEGYLVIDIVPVYVWDKLEAERKQAREFSQAVER
jgi:hypothetical protein